MSRSGDDDFAGDSRELAIGNERNGIGLITRPHEHGLSPAIAAESQRARSEIEASLTIAAARPRDERDCLDQILVSCQRPGVAEEAEYEYSRGGTAITGPTVKLLELVAQKWGNLSWGFRELARYEGSAGQAGSSTMQAFAWDLQSNSRRTVDFVVPHSIKSHGKTKILTDDRDVYELIANVAQRRVRTSLENVIPRDIVDSAVEECHKTLRTNEEMSPDKTAKMVGAFAAFGVTAQHIETWIQRRIDTMTPAQMVRLRRIYTSLRDGMSQPSDWFHIDEATPPKSVVERAKDVLRKRSKQPAAAQAVDPSVDARRTGDAERVGTDGRRSEPEPIRAEEATTQGQPEPAPEPEPEPEPEPGAIADLFEEFCLQLQDAATPQAVRELQTQYASVWDVPYTQKAQERAEMRLATLQPRRGPRSNKQSSMLEQPAAFPDANAQV